MSGKRKSTANYNYFSKIDTEEKAYWLGFIMADGCLMSYSRWRHLKTMCSIQNRKYLQISLSSVDREHLIKFNNCLNSTYEIKDYKQTNSEGCYSRIIIEDEKLFYDLIANGVYPRKTGKEEFPKTLSENMIRHFIRGFFDGDGCISKYKSPHGTDEYELNVVGTKEILYAILDYLPIDKNKNLTQRKQSSKNNYTLRVQGSNQIKRVLDYLYDNSSIYLSRKFDMYQSFKKRCDEINEYLLTGKGSSRVWWKHHILQVGEPANAGCNTKCVANGETPNILFKRCSCCKEILPLEKFHNDKRQKRDGHVAQCKNCKQDYDKHYRRNKSDEDDTVPSLD